MKYRRLVLSTVIVIFSNTLIACSSPQGVSIEVSPIMPVFTESPTIASQQISLSGTAFLTVPSGQGGWPLLTNYVELRQGDFSVSAEYPDANRPQKFIFDNIEPGTYQLWVLIPSLTLTLKNCYDIGLPDNSWRLGKVTVNERTIFPSNTSYREVFLQVQNEQLLDPKNNYDFYAVMENLDIKSGADNNIDATLICEYD